MAAAAPFSKIGSFLVFSRTTIYSGEVSDVMEKYFCVASTHKKTSFFKKLNEDNNG